jgi:glycosyltransferase involved in cell wall biosynthesis
MKSDISKDLLQEYFDPIFYLEKYPDVMRAGIDPLDHFYRHGLWEGRSPSADFDPNWYENQYPEIRQTNLSALAHYLSEGKNKGYLTKQSNLFWQRTYLSKYLSIALSTPQDDLISVIVTVKNPISDWGASLNSLLGQSYQNFEAIIIIDRDEEDLPETSPFDFPSNISDDRFKVYHTRKIGRSNALNYGLELSTGDYIAYLDSDNWYDANFLLLMRYELLNKKTELIYCGRYLINESGDVSLAFAPFNLIKLRANNYIDLNALMHSRGLLNRVGNFDPNLSRLIDYDFVLRIAELFNNVRGIPLFLSYYDNSPRRERISICEDLDRNKRLVQKKNFKKQVSINKDFYLNYQPIRPKKIRLEVSSACQLRCPSCPTATKETLKVVGQNLLQVDNFEKFINQAPWLRKIEISNYGEIFLNPKLPRILELAHENGITITCENGVNLNNISEESLEAVVKYGVQSLVCSIDGVSQEIYEKYRVRGNLTTVLANLKKLNEFKKKYQRETPKLIWQFILFEHNKDQVSEAKKLAEELSMDFRVKTSWDSDLAPSHINSEIAKVINLKAISRKEEYQNLGHHSSQGICKQLWDEPQINWDGKVLGCCRNFWGDFGQDTFNIGLEKAINSEKMSYARLMLKGLVVSRSDIPCTSCEIYKDRQARKDWIL